MSEIINYFIEEKGETAVVARILEKNLIKYDDIKNSFLDWLNTRNYSEKPVIEGYNAKEIHELYPELDASGVYQFLVTLRDNPQKAQRYLDDNFSKK